MTQRQLWEDGPGVWSALLKVREAGARRAALTCQYRTNKKRKRSIEIHASSCNRCAMSGEGAAYAVMQHVTRVRRSRMPDWLREGVEANEAKENARIHDRYR